MTCGSAPPVRMERRWCVCRGWPCLQVPNSPTPASLRGPMDARTSGMWPDVSLAVGVTGTAMSTTATVSVSSAGGMVNCLPKPLPAPCGRGEVGGAAQPVRRACRGPHTTALTGMPGCQSRKKYQALRRELPCGSPGEVEWQPEPGGKSTPSPPGCQRPTSSIPRGPRACPHLPGSRLLNLHLQRLGGWGGCRGSRPPIVGARA